MYENIRSGIYLADGSSIPARNVFYRIAEFLDFHPAYDRIASQVGVSLDATSFPDAVGMNAYGVWRKASGSHVWDVIVAYNTSSLASSPGGNLLYHYNTSSLAHPSLGIAFAWHSSSQAWDGTTNNDGTDLFVTSPWKSGSVVLPSENSDIPFNVEYWGAGYYAFAPNKNLLTTFDVSNINSTNHKIILSADDNSFYAGMSTNDSTTEKYICFQKYVPVTASYNLPYFMNTYNVTNNYTFYTDNGAFSRIFAGGAGGGLSISQNTPTATYNSTSFDAQIVFDKFMEFSPTLLENLRFTAPDGKVWLFSPYLLSYAWERKYVGYPEFMILIPGFKCFDRVGNNTWLVVGDNANFVSSSVRWASNFTGSMPTGTNYTQAAYVATGSTPTPFSHVSMSNLFEPITVGVSDIPLYRSLAVGQYYYGDTNPVIGGASNTIALKEHKTDDTTFNQ